MIELLEVSRETFLDHIGDGDYTATLGEPYDEDDLAVTHYTYRDAYLGTMRVTEDGAIYYIPDTPSEGISIEEAYDLIYGA